MLGSGSVFSPMAALMGRLFRRNTTAVPAAPIPRAAEERGTDVPAADSLVADARSRAAYAEAQLDQARAWAAELKARFRETQAALQETQVKLMRAEGELLQIRQQVRGLEDRKEAEMGRLESGAIAALEAAMTTHKEQIAMLEEELQASENTVQEHLRELTLERNRSAQLRSALAERDEHLASLGTDRS